MSKIDNDYLTPQEHNLFGSSVFDYEQNPYTPIIVQRGEVSVDDCNRVRQEIGFSKVTSGAPWGVKYLDCKMSLEELSDNGETLKDPVLIEVNIQYDKIKDKRSSFPFARQSPVVKLK